MTNEELAREIADLKKRNIKVDQDKAWEISLTRKVLIAFITYVLVSIFFYFASVSKPMLNALVPTMGFLLSTISMSYVKDIWIRHFK